MHPISMNGGECRPLGDDDLTLNPLSDGFLDPLDSLISPAQKERNRRASTMGPNQMLRLNMIRDIVKLKNESNWVAWSQQFETFLKHIGINPVALEYLDFDSDSTMQRLLLSTCQPSIQSVIGKLPSSLAMWRKLHRMFGPVLHDKDDITYLIARVTMEEEESLNAFCARFEGLLLQAKKFGAYMGHAAAVLFRAIAWYDWDLSSELFAFREDDPVDRVVSMLRYLKTRAVEQIGDFSDDNSDDENVEVTSDVSKFIDAKNSSGHWDVDSSGMSVDVPHGWAIPN